MGSDTDWKKRRRRSLLGESVDTDPDAARHMPHTPSNKLERTVPGTKRSTTIPLGPPPKRR